MYQLNYFLFNTVSTAFPTYVELLLFTQSTAMHTVITFRCTGQGYVFLEGCENLSESDITDGHKTSTAGGTRTAVLHTGAVMRSKFQ